MDKRIIIFFLPLFAMGIALPLSKTVIFQHLEFMSYDFILRNKTEYGYKGNEVLVVGITPQDIKLYGKPPWTRRYYTQLVNILHMGGAKVIAFDMFFPSKSELHEDRAFAKAIYNAGNVILGVFDEDFPKYIETKNYKNRKVYVVNRLTENLDLFKKSCWNQAHINVLPDSDDVVRRLPLFIFDAQQKKPIYSLGFLAFLKYKNIEEIRFLEKYLIAGDTKIPTDKYNNIRINYSKWIKERKNDFTFPISWVLSGVVPPSTFKDKIVLIGWITRGLPDADIVNTPFGTRMIEKEFGLMINVYLTNSLLRKKFLYDFPFLYYLLILFTFSFAAFWGMSRFRFLGASLLTLGIMAFMFSVAVLCMNYGNMVFPVIPFGLTSIFNLSASTFISVKRQDVEITKKESQLRSIGELSHLVTTTEAGREESLDTVVATIAQIIGASACILREIREGEISPPLVSYNESFEAESLLKADFELVKECIKQNSPLNIREIMRQTETLEEIQAIALICPLKVENVPLGVISIYRKNTLPFSSDEFDLFVTLSNQTAVALKNAQLYKNAQRLFLDSIRALSAAIDAKDPYTEGHSERVTSLSVVIAKEMGLPPETHERIRLAAQFHDIGKIGIRDAVLRKKGRLNNSEYEEMKKHPEIGARILQHIHELRDVVPGMRHHHERYDGKGYPEHLRESEIPLFARILCVADSFDAITSDRPYRKGMSLEVACREIKKNTGTQFDPKATEALLRLVARFQTTYKSKKISVNDFINFIESL
ncbi:MAG TPA: CHASE2 domain-containing protein [Candidatus Omnitrophica bacterium]|nr:CHASE2 domain-containing protein [Candidatus Omnitrophota bacterium]